MTSPRTAARTRPDTRGETLKALLIAEDTPLDWTVQRKMPQERIVMTAKMTPIHFFPRPFSMKEKVSVVK